MDAPKKNDPEVESAIALLADTLRAELLDLQTSGIAYLPRRVPAGPQPNDKMQPQHKKDAAPTQAQAPKANVTQPGKTDVSPPHSPKQANQSGASPVQVQSQPDSNPVKGSGEAEERLRILKEEEIGDCQNCKLHRSRTNLVFGVGNPRADLVFVGEGPGADEDRQGVPFVGRAGQLLTKMIEAMGFSRDDVYICNVVKCRPPNNRDPESDEVEACSTFLKEQLSVIQPKVIVGLGRFACHTLLETNTPITRLRGQWATYSGVEGKNISLMPTFHPAYLLRSPERKREAWSDLKEVMKRLEKPGAK
jgi:uracil-DNA glycosylase